jgi:hypothetical protein
MIFVRQMKKVISWFFLQILFNESSSKIKCVRIITPHLPSLLFHQFQEPNCEINPLQCRLPCLRVTSSPFSFRFALKLFFSSENTFFSRIEVEDHISLSRIYFSIGMFGNRSRAVQSTVMTQHLIEVLNVGDSLNLLILLSVMINFQLPLMSCFNSSLLTLQPQISNMYVLPGH